MTPVIQLQQSMEVQSMESVINIYFWPEVSKLENFPTANFRTEFTYDWFKEDFTQFVLKDIDKCEWIEKDVVRSPILGVIPVDNLSGAFKTLTMAYHFKDLKFPLRNLGDNCAKSIYRSALEGPTSWNYQGYMSHVLPEQVCYFPELDARVMGDKVDRWLILETPEEYNPVARRKREWEAIVAEEGGNGSDVY